MLTNRRRVIGASAAILLFLCGGLILTQEREPTSGGKYLSEWLKQYDKSTGDFPPEAIRAFSEIGPAALIKIFSRERSPLSRRLRYFLFSYGFRPSNSESEEFLAVQALAVSITNAAELVKLAYPLLAHPQTDGYALHILLNIREPVMQPLLDATRAGDLNASNAVQKITRHRSGHKAPYILRLAHPNAEARCEALSHLYGGPVDKWIIDAIVWCLDDPDRRVRLAALSTLERYGLVLVPYHDRVWKLRNDADEEVRRKADRVAEYIRWLRYPAKPAMQQ